MNIPSYYGEIGTEHTPEALARVQDAAFQMNVSNTFISPTDNGYAAPPKVIARYEQDNFGADAEDPDVESDTDEGGSDTEPVEQLPDESWKNADIEAWAEAHKVDLGGASKKADMLAVIAAANNKEE